MRELIIAVVLIGLAACIGVSGIVVVALASPTPSVAALPPPTSGKLYIVPRGWKCEPSYGSVVFSGTIRNQTGDPVRSVRIRGEVINQSGSTINTNYGYADSDIIAPNASSTFRFYVNDPKNVVDSCNVFIESYQ